VAADAHLAAPRGEDRIRGRIVTEVVLDYQIGILSVCFRMLDRKKGTSMAAECQVCGKRPQVGNTVETRGKAKYLGGVGTKITGITRRQFKPNLQRVKVALPNGGNRSIRVCTQCIRSGAIRKAVRRKPFALNPADAKMVS
jgi:large subunit ribosomal protein L28